MDRFDDVQVVATVDESPPAPRVPRRARRAFTGVVAAVVVTGALAGATVGLADEKSEPSGTAAEGPVLKESGHDCERGEGLRKRSAERSGAFRY